MNAQWRVSGQSPLAGTYQGAAQILGYFAQLRERSGGTFHATVLDVMTSPTRACVLARATGTRGNASYDKQYALVLRVEAGILQSATLFNEDQRAFDAFWSDA